ncbi:MAG: 1-acyl-sn-glycerol-3-phosphate acyltransferase [Bdellovibrionales bacterium]|nr:1-acyl-sn-glycerol-3-phosphate acyltransferase [Bdellovibrionales bacterium]
MTTETTYETLPIGQPRFPFASWLISPIHLFLFWCILLGFHIPLMIARLFGQRTIGAVYTLLCGAHVANIKLSGTHIHFTQEQPLPVDRPLILVSNHQSMYDIPCLVWFLRQHHPRFIAKKELTKYIPSISFALRHCNHLLIDRDDPHSAVEQITSYAKTVEQNRTTICIFPEGTRAKDAKMKRFKSRGLETLLKEIPSALVVPIALDGFAHLVKKKFFPFPYGETATLQVFSPLEPSQYSAKELTAVCERQIRNALGQS